MVWQVRARCVGDVERRFFCSAGEECLPSLVCAICSCQTKNADDIKVYVFSRQRSKPDMSHFSYGNDKKSMVATLNFISKTVVYQVMYNCTISRANQRATLALLTSAKNVILYIRVRVNSFRSVADIRDLSLCTKGLVLVTKTQNRHNHDDSM